MKKKEFEKNAKKQKDEYKEDESVETGLFMRKK